MMKLIGTIVMLVITIISARSCSSSSSPSPLDPNTVEQNGLAGMCATQSLIPGSSSATVVLPSLPGLNTSGTFTCPTTTLP